ncbi:unnamed protein product, partial [Thlaspi arvense]
AQSPNPLEILSKKSPEKLLLPQPTDLDLSTFLPKDEPPPLPTPFVGVSATTWLLGLSSSSSAITSMPPPPTLFDDSVSSVLWFLPFSIWFLGLEEWLKLSTFLAVLLLIWAREVVEEGVKVLGEEEERCVCLGRGKEEVTSLPSFSWRHNAQIPPGFLV